MEEICRLCATRSASLKSAFSLKNGRIISDMISIICPIKIQLDDNLPQSVCTSCVNIIYDAVDLRERSIQSDQNFKLKPAQLPITIKIERDPFNQELWLEDENVNSPESKQSSNDADDYFPEDFLENSARKTPKNTKTSCHLCGYQFAHVSNVKRHLARFHDPSFPLTCDQCSCRFKSEARLRTHIEKHHRINTSMVQLPMSNLKELQDLVDENVDSQKSSESSDDDADYLPEAEAKKSPRKPGTVGNFSCYLCGDQFSHAWNVKRHLMRYHDPSLPLKCESCSCRFKSEARLKTHLEQVHKVGVIVQFPVPELKVLKHKSMDSPESSASSDDDDFRGGKAKKSPRKPGTVGNFSCHLCGDQFSHAWNVKRHLMRYHDPSLPLACEHCSCRFKSEVRFRAHIYQIHKVDSTVFPDLKAVENREVKSMEGKESSDNDDSSGGEAEKKPQNLDKTASKCKRELLLLPRHESILCDHCGKNFVNRTILERHLSIFHRPKDLKPDENEANFVSGCYPCNMCEKSFTMKQNLYRHFQRFHSRDLKFKCKQCNDRFKSEILLERHVMKIHENPNGLFTKISEVETKSSSEAAIVLEDFDNCKFCFFELHGSKYRYEQHMLTSHEDKMDKILSCDICPKRFVFLKSLKFHVEVHRKRAREEHFPFQCKTCFRKFLSEEKFKRHLSNSHKVAAPYICNICGKEMDTNKKFKYHMLCHSNIRNFQCAKCGMKFLESKNLKRHMSTHTDARPYVCAVVGCDKAFKASDSLRKHERKVHPMMQVTKIEAAIEIKDVDETSSD